ncbi:ribosome silencing factor [Hydrogenophaga sp.]|uniref:ribosome silencing factor n=1 Tax=Hydrogenophaga sp. TaxID=1904254 RepID=UPI0025BB07D0|nr:ribosome silencing factor [Hydrogenophaga sp.]
MSSETTAKKDVQKLQRAIIDGLEDVKGQDIVVFDTESLSPLFERVIIASGTSNRQTKALAASVRDAVREAGFDKPRIEGEDNGEWIIVDCGAAVAHVMQPVIRQYYRLEEIWGGKPVRMKHGAPKPVQSATKPVAKKKAAAKKGSPASAAPVPAKTVVRQQAKATAVAAQKAPARKAAPVKSAAGKAAVRKAPAKTTAKTATKAPVKSTPKAAVKTVVIKAKAAKPGAKTSAKPGARKTSAVKSPARKKA